MKKLMILSMIMFFSMAGVRSEAATLGAADGFYTAGFDFARYWTQFFYAAGSESAKSRNDVQSITSNAVFEQMEQDAEEDGLKAFSIWPAMTRKEALYFQGFSRIVSDIAYHYNETYDMDLNPEKIFEQN